MLWRVLLLLMTAFPGGLAAQEPIARGVWVVGGDALLYGQHDAANDVSEYGFRLRPQAGLFVAPGLLVSSNLVAGWSTRQRSASATELGIGPGISYYISGLGRRLYPYVSLRTLYVYTRFASRDDSPAQFKETDHEWTWVVAGGAAIFVARNVALTGELFYSGYRVTIDLIQNGSTLPQRNRSTQYGLQFGFRMFLF